MNDVKKARHPNRNGAATLLRDPVFITRVLDTNSISVLWSFLWHKGSMAKHSNRRFGFVTLFLVYKDKNPVTFLKN